MAKLIWTPTALADLEALLDYIAIDAPRTAERFAQRLIERVEQLAIHPLSGSFIAEEQVKVHREILQGNYRIIHRVTEDVVYIVAVCHAARLLDADDLH